MPGPFCVMNTKEKAVAWENHDFQRISLGKISYKDIFRLLLGGVIEK